MKPKTKKLLGVSILALLLVAFFVYLGITFGFKELAKSLFSLAILGLIFLGSWLIASGTAEEDEEEIKRSVESILGRSYRK